MSYLINKINHLSTTHKHSTYEIIIYIRGKGKLVAEGKVFTTLPGTIAIIPPNTTHSASSDEDLERIYISGDFNQIFNLTSPAIISDNQEKEGTSLAKMIYNNRYENPDYIVSLCNALAHFLAQNLKMDDAIGTSVREIINEITNNFSDCNINLCHILNKSGYSEDYIRSQFKKYTKKTPTEFLSEIRIRHACYLIDVYRSTLSLSEISEKCGYTDYIYFSRKFKQIKGISPQKYKDLC